jgi:hypothetical protein
MMLTFFASALVSVAAVYAVGRVTSSTTSTSSRTLSAPMNAR